MEIPSIDHLLGPDLSTQDPYDLWKTKLGLWLRRMYYQNGLIAVPLVAPFFLLDAYAPRVVRAFIGPQEYPTVRAMAVLAALNLHQINPDPKYLSLAEESAGWLLEHQSPGYHGACWGLNFPWMTKGGYYPPTTPFITHTPYCVEALFKCFDATRKEKYYSTAVSTLNFLEVDLHILFQSSDKMAMGYGPGMESRIVVNANSYAMMLYALLATRMPENRDALLEKAGRLFNYVTAAQNADGSWFYYNDSEKGNFIDCFHSCFVMKNLIKYGRYTGVDLLSIVDKGLDYVLGNFVDPDYNLARRFTVSANPSFVKFDLYDQAELLNVLLLRGRQEDAEKLLQAVMKHFYLPDRRSFGYQIDIFGLLNKMSYLRWAVMPMTLVLSEYLISRQTVLATSQR
ncbi:MAG: hypothetical protein A2075_01060 [Geobacteraceae bacterium GWC2_58_44]|nr:MAG: hypothetical protein A2075_01060 [Geobacteraceae bacterium GWC2_58_44]HBG07393.1 hypothetical protein [Geobacter sp.]